MADLLLQLGLNEKEIKVYKTLLKHGKLTPAAIAKLTKINRTTVYSTAKLLVAKGMVAEDLGGKTLSFIATPPASLNKLLDQQKVELKAKEKLLSAVVEELSLLGTHTELLIPKIRFIEEQSLEKYLYKEAKKWDSSARTLDSTWWGFQDHSLVEKYEKWIHWLWKSVHKDSIVNMFSNHSNTERRLRYKYPKRQVKFLENQNFTATTWVVGNYLILVSCGQSPSYLIEIHDTTLSHNMRELFKNLWLKT